MNANAVKRALAEAMALVDEADVAALRKRRGGPEVEIEVKPGGEECPECAKGMCSEHLSPEDAEGMASMYEGA
jgi:hypothetical protein